MPGRASPIGEATGGAYSEIEILLPEKSGLSGEMRLPGPAFEPISLSALRQFSRETSLSSGAQRDLRLFQGLARRSPESSAPQSLLKRIYETWKNGPQGGPLLMGFGFLLGAGISERLRREADLTTVTYRDGESSISIGRRSSQAEEGAPGPDLDFFDVRSVSHEQAELFREGKNLYLRDLDSKNGTWIWRSGHWSRVERNNPVLLQRGAVIAFGGYPEIRQLSELPAQPGELGYVVVRFEAAPEQDVFRIRRIHGKSLDYFLSDVFGHGSLFADKRGFPPRRKLFGEIMGLVLRFGLNRESYRLQIAQRLQQQGHFVESMKEIALAQENLEGRLENRIPQTEWLDPEEIPLKKVLGALYSQKGFLLQAMQEPEAAATFFAKAAEQYDALRGVNDKTTANADFQFAMNASLAYRLHLQEAERSNRGQQYVKAALAYEQAALFSEGAKEYAALPLIKRYIPVDVLDESALLGRAALCFLRSGPSLSEELQRVVRKIETLRGPKDGIFR